jgi:hypothetical protein
MASESVSIFTVVLSPDPLSPTPSISSTMKTSDAQSSGASASLVDTEETLHKIERGPDAPELATEGDIQIEHFSDKLCPQNIGAVTQYYL